MTDEDREIVFNTQVEHTTSKAVASGPDSSDSKMDAIMQALQSISSQNKGIELKIEQQDRKADVQVQEISERFENLGAGVNKQAAHMGSQLKLHGDKLAAKINVFEEEFSNTVASLNAKHRSFERNRQKQAQGNTRKARFEAKRRFTSVRREIKRSARHKEISAC